MGFTIENHYLPVKSKIFGLGGEARAIVGFFRPYRCGSTRPIGKMAFPSFTGTVRDASLFGRGAADMKSALAAMIIACKNLFAEHPDHAGSLGFMITSDEEGEAQDGTVKMVEYFQAARYKTGLVLDRRSQQSARVGRCY